LTVFEAFLAFSACLAFISVIRISGRSNDSIASLTLGDPSLILCHSKTNLILLLGRSILRKNLMKNWLSIGNLKRRSEGKRVRIVEYSD